MTTANARWSQPKLLPSVLVQSEGAETALVGSAEVQSARVAHVCVRLERTPRAQGAPDPSEHASPQSLLHHPLVSEQKASHAFVSQYVQLAFV